jgi:hypothetical protein
MHKDQVRPGSLRRADSFINSSRSILQPLYRPHILRHTWNEEGYAMTLWGDRFRTHTLWAELERARQAVNEMKIDAQDGPGQQMLAYVGAVVELLEKRHDGSEALEVAPSMLDATYSAVSNWADYIEYVNSGTYTSDQLLQPTDSVIASLASWPPLKPARYISGIAASVDAFGSKTASILAELDSKADGLRSSLVSVEEQRSTLELAMDTENQRVREALARFETTSAEEMQGIRDDQQSSLEAQKARWEEEENDAREQAALLLTTLSDHEKTARDTVHATTALSVATDYGKYARNKTFAAWVCDIAGALVGASGVVAILVHLFSISPESDSNVGLSVTRLAASLGTLGIAALLGRRGAQHHREARAAKRTDLALRKVGPFIVTLPEDEQQLIIQEFTDRVFIRGELDGENAGSMTSLTEKIRDLRGKRTDAKDAAA